MHSHPMPRPLRHSRTVRILAFLFVLGALALTPVRVTAATTILYVDEDADGDDDGSSWGDAFEDLQEALSAAADLNPTSFDPVEIWVAQGIYRPGEDKGDSFVLQDHVALYGGFVGDEEFRYERDTEENTTILSGDLDDDDSQQPIVTNPITNNNTEDNAYHVVRSNDNESSAVLDGFVITAGVADDGDDDEITNQDGGGGLLILGGEPTIQGNAFIGNSARFGGGAIAIGNSGTNPSILGNAFIDNVSYEGAAVLVFRGAAADFTSNILRDNVSLEEGGAAALVNTGTVTFTNNSVRNNTAENEGGAFFIVGDAGLAIFERNIFEGNETEDDGGAIFSEGAVILRENTFTENTANDNGGAITIEARDADIFDNTFTENEANDNGGAIEVVSKADVNIAGNTFTANRSEGNGGAIFNAAETDAYIVGNFFHANRADPDEDANGGAIAMVAANTRVINNVLVGNSAFRGGGIYSVTGGSPDITNNTLAENEATDNGGGLWNGDADIVVSNNIFWDNETGGTNPEIFEDEDGSPVYEFNIVEGGTLGGINRDPEFVDKPEPGLDGSWADLDGNDYGDLRVNLGSPAIDAGDEDFLPLPQLARFTGSLIPEDIAGKDRIHNNRVDIGAYEFQPGLLLTPEEITLREGTTTSYNLSLYAPYTSAQSVSVVLSAGDGLEISSDGEEFGDSLTLSIPSGDWNDPQTITVRVRGLAGAVTSVLHTVTDAPEPYEDLPPVLLPLDVNFRSGNLLLNGSFEDPFTDFNWSTVVIGEDDLDGRQEIEAAQAGDWVFGIENNGESEFLLQNSLMTDGRSGELVELVFYALGIDLPEAEDEDDDVGLIGARLRLFEEGSPTGDMVMCTEEVPRGSFSTWQRITCTLEATESFDQIEVGIGALGVPSGILGLDNVQLYVRDVVD